MRATLLTLCLATMFALGCNGAATRSDTGPITREQAIETAHETLQKEPFAADINVDRMTVYHGKWGPKRDVRVRWVIDFARHGSPEITPGQWARGYQVVIEQDTGDVFEASAYIR